MYDYEDWKSIYLHKRRCLRTIFNLTINNIEEKLAQENNPILYVEGQIMNRVKPRIRNLYGFGSLYPLEIQEVTREMMLDYDHYLMVKEEMEKLEDILAIMNLYQSTKYFISVDTIIQYLMDILTKTAEIIQSWEDEDED